MYQVLEESKVLLVNQDYQDSMDDLQKKATEVIKENKVLLDHAVYLGVL